MSFNVQQIALPFIREYPCTQFAIPVMILFKKLINATKSKTSGLSGLLRVMVRVPSKLDKLKNWQAIAIIALLGVAVFADGMKNPFEGDDLFQVQDNIVVHSLSHIPLLFRGSTFYLGHGYVPLSGSYYRPLMMLCYALLYSGFGPHPFYFRLLQLLLTLGSVFLVYLVFKHFFKPSVALPLSLIYLVHPINDQAVFAIANMQECLYFFFGILGFYILLHYRTYRALPFVALSVFLSLLAKETGALFILAGAAYLLLFDKARMFFAYIGSVSIPVAIWLVLRLHAVGFGKTPDVSAIDRLNLPGRLLNIPAIVQLYFERLLFPYRQSDSYYWAYRSFSLHHVLGPLMFDLLVLGILAYLGYVLYAKAPRANLRTYLFFAGLFAAGLIIHLQLLPLDFTASEIWFSFSMFALLGMVGTFLATFWIFINPKIFLVLASVLIVVLGVRTAVRGTDYRTPLYLAQRDVVASSQDYYDTDVIAGAAYDRHEYGSSQALAAQSVTYFPTFANLHLLGLDYFSTGQDSLAFGAFTRSVAYQSDCPTYDIIAVMSLAFGGAKDNQRVLTSGENSCPKDGTIAYYLALDDYRLRDIAGAKTAITRARDNPTSTAKLSGLTIASIDAAYKSIMAEKPIIVGGP